jgi:hypothetical protein
VSEIKRKKCEMKMKGFEPWPRGWEFRVLNTTVLNFDYEDKTFFARK